MGKVYELRIQDGFVDFNDHIHDTLDDILTSASKNIAAARSLRPSDRRAALIDTTQAVIEETTILLREIDGGMHVPKVQHEDRLREMHGSLQDLADNLRLYLDG